VQEAAGKTTALRSSALAKHKEQFLSVRLSFLGEGKRRHVLIEREVSTLTTVALHMMAINSALISCHTLLTPFIKFWKIFFSQRIERKRRSLQLSKI
jgi:hypothetical protein